MTLTSLTLPLRKHEYFRYFNFIIFVDFVLFFDILQFYAMNMNDVSLFSNSSFLILSILNYIILDDIILINLN